MTLFEKFCAEGNEKADELTNSGAMFDGGEMTQIRASTSGKEIRFTLHCSSQTAFHHFVEEDIRGQKWKLRARKDRCVRCREQ